MSNKNTNKTVAQATVLAAGTASQGASALDATRTALMGVSDKVEALINSPESTAAAVMASAAGETIDTTMREQLSVGARPGIRVVSRAPSFRRAGREFTAEATTIPLDDLTEDQYKAIVSEPELVVVKVFIDPEPEST